jgi:DNA-binding SARP family transcriptional activator/tetratricopeptide (TPR) repeat protein
MAAHGSRGNPQSSAPLRAVEVVTLGRFEVAGPGAVADAGGGRPLTLLKLLIALGGRTVPAAQVSDALWPDADGHAAHRALITNLQRLRKLIGTDAVALQGGQLSLDTERCRVDALHLPRHLDGIAAASEPQSLLRHAGEVLGLYRGRFLPGEFDPPEIISTRTRLHARVVHGIVAAGERLIRHGRIEDAIELLREGLGIDDRAEALYRPLLRAYAQSARWSDGIEAYARCRDALREFHGVSPSPETVQLYRTCMERGSGAGGRAGAEPAARGAAPEEQRRVAVALIATAEAGPGVREHVAQTMLRFGGTMQDSGEASVLAVFGAPIAHEDDAERAVRAAWALVRDVRSPGQPAARGAIESGLVVARTAREGGALRLEGEPLDEARRLLAAARPGQVFVGQATHLRVADYFQCEPVRESALAAGTPAWRVSGETGVDSHFAVSKQRGLAPFLGRERELQRLREALQRALAGEGGVVLVSGEPGIGKSRLLYEFTAGVDRRAAAVVEAACRAYGERTPYDPFVQAVRALFDLEPAAPAEHQARQVAERMRGLDPGLARYTPYYQRLLSLPVTGNGGGALLATGVALRRVTKEAVGALAVQASRARPLLLVLEDWHWSDESSDEVLRHLQALVPSHRMLLVLTQRSAYPLRGLEPAGLEIVRLGPLAEQESFDLVRDRLGTADVSERLARLVLQRAGGNPFFIEEICSDLRRHADAGADAPPADAEIAIPETVQGMLRNRLDDIDRGAREAALSAAVIGREFSLRLLLEVHEDREGLEDDLDRLKARDLIHQTGVLPEVEYRFKHALTQVVAYDALLPARRRILHERAGRAIERLYAGRTDEQVESLARHFVAAADVERAVKYLEQAGDKAVRAHATAAAVGHYRQAFELLDTHAPTPQTLRRRIDLSCKWAEVTHYVSAHESLKVLGRSLVLAKRLADPSREARVLYWIGRPHHVVGDPKHALPHFRRALTCTQSARGGGIAPQIHGCIGRAVFVGGDLRGAVRELELALSGLDFASDPTETCYSTSYLALALSQLGAFDRSFRLHERAVDLARAAGDRTQEASALLRVAISRVAMGDWQAAVGVARDSAAMAARLENPMTAGWAEFHEGQARFMLGEAAAGLAQCERGLAMVEGSGAHLGFSIFLANLAGLYALAGDHGQATEIAARALAYRRGGANLGLYYAHHALALVAEHRPPGDVRLARSRLAFAHRLALAAGALPAVAIGRLRKAELHARQGEPDLAMAALREAIAGFESLGMGWWLEQARRFEAERGLRRGKRRAAGRRA